MSLVNFMTVLSDKIGASDVRCGKNVGKTHKCNKGNLLIIRRLPLLFRDPDRILFSEYD